MNYIKAMTIAGNGRPVRRDGMPDGQFIKRFRAHRRAESYIALFDLNKDDRPVTRHHPTQIDQNSIAWYEIDPITGARKKEKQGK